MRILMVCEDLPALSMGGLAKHVLTLCKTLKQQGHQVDLMGNNDSDWPVGHSYSEYVTHFYGELKGQYLGWKESQLGLFNPVKRTYTAKRFAQAIQLRAKAYDVIHYHGHLPNIAKFIPSYLNFIQTRHDQGSECLTHIRFKNGDICNALDAKTCAACRTSHPNWLQQKISAFAVRRFRLEVQQGFKKHKTIFVSDFLSSNIQRCFGTGAWGITLHNFIDEYELQQAQLNTSHSFPLVAEKRIKVFIAAKLYAAKGIAEFLTAMTQLNSKHIQIDIAGDGPLEQQLKNQYQGLGVIFHGWQSASNTLILAMQSDVMVVPSVCEEACPTTVLEGLTLGKTVFALERGGTTELVIYEKYPQQLKLFQTMSNLAASLTQFRAPSSQSIASYRYPDVSYAAQSLMKFYQLPPGFISE